MFAKQERSILMKLKQSQEVIVIRIALLRSITGTKFLLKKGIMYQKVLIYSKLRGVKVLLT